tara:strand:+ start:1075 stop:1707 length:633 start_codon:yes stop_codon:yes gene_type:complete
MHKETYSINVAFFCNKNFINAVNELKSFFGFNLLLEDQDLNLLNDKKINAVICDTDNSKKILNTNIKKPKILIQENNKNNFNQNMFSLVVKLPLDVVEFNQDIINLCMKFEFDNNSLIKIKDYFLDKNERILKKDDIFLKITEKEIDFIEILHSSNKPLNRDFILKNIWNYSSDTDTHTVETHIYRLRQKIKNSFDDDSFIKNSKNGYYL